jgi:hypothetical protein
VPTPSAEPDVLEGDPATVVTTNVDSTSLRRRFPNSDINAKPSSDDNAMKVGYAKAADVPMPFAPPLVPDPATRVTTLLDSTTLRIR